MSDLSTQWWKGNLETKLLGGEWMPAVALGRCRQCNKRIAKIYAHRSHYLFVGRGEAGGWGFSDAIANAKRHFGGAMRIPAPTGLVIVLVDWDCDPVIPHAYCERDGRRSLNRDELKAVITKYRRERHERHVSHFHM